MLLFFPLFIPFTVFSETVHARYFELDIMKNELLHSGTDCSYSSIFIHFLFFLLLLSTLKFRICDTVSRELLKLDPLNLVYAE